MFMSHKESTLKTNNLTHAIWKDASKGDVKAIQKKIAKGESPHVETDEKKTPLHYAAEFGHINAADALLNAGARIDQRDNKGDTPVHVALKAKQEEMALFLAAKGADLYLTNSSSQSSFDLAARVSNRFIIKLREGSRCSNPAPVATVVAKPKAVVETTTYYPLLNQIVITFGEYSMLVRSLPSLGAPAQPDRTPPFPTSPFHALQLCIGKLKSLTEQIIIANNSGQFSPEFKGNTSNFRENVNNLNNLLRQPIADAITFNAIQDTSMITTKLTDMFVQYEQGVVGMIFKSHMEKFVMDIKKVSENPLFPDLVLDFIHLYRNVLVQLMFIRDPEKSKLKDISDGLQQCCQLLKELIKAKMLGQAPQVYIRSIAENLTKMNHSLLQVGHDSALFQEEELEVFESGSQMLRDIEKLEIGLQDKRVIEILQSEILYIKEAITNPPPEPELLLNCSLFISSTCSRISKYLQQQQQQQQPLSQAKKKWIDVGIGFLMQCHNQLILIACALVNKNRQFHFVHIGYVIRAIACVVSILLDPEFYIE